MEGRTLRITLLLSLLLAGSAEGIEHRRGYVRLTPELICLNRCDFYNLEPDSSYEFTFLRPDPTTAIDLNQYVDMHVEVFGYKSGCGGCSVFYVSTIVQLSTAGVGGEGELPLASSLLQNYPNPFNPSTNIEYVLRRQATVTLRVFDLLGREVAVLASSRQPAGHHRVAWDASAFPDGVYYYTLHITSPQGEPAVQTKAMVLLR